MSGTTRARGPYAKTAERRAAVARAALDVVIEKGHGALTTAEVARRAGMSERAMLYHFPTRDHILAAALELSHDETRAALRSRKDPGADAPDVDLGCVPIELVASTADRLRVVRLFAHLAGQAADPDHPAHDVLRRHNHEAVTAFAALVRRRQQAGLAHPDIDPGTVARQLLAVWHGLQAQWLVEPDFDLGDAVAQAFRRLTGQPTMEARQLLDEVIARI